MSAKYIFTLIPLIYLYRNFDKNIFSKLIGSFIDSNATEKRYEDLAKHPLVPFSLGSITQIEQLINHPEIESLLYVQKGKLYQLLLPRVVQEFDLEIESPTSKVVGVVGKYINKYSVVSFTRKEILGDFWTYLNESAQM